MVISLGDIITKIEKGKIVLDFNSPEQVDFVKKAVDDEAGFIRYVQEKREVLASNEILFNFINNLKTERIKISSSEHIDLLFDFVEKYKNSSLYTQSRDYLLHKLSELKAKENADSLEEKVIPDLNVVQRADLPDKTSIFSRWANYAARTAAVAALAFMYSCDGGPSKDQPVKETEGDRQVRIAREQEERERQAYSERMKREMGYFHKAGAEWARDYKSPEPEKTTPQQPQPEPEKTKPKKPDTEIKSQPKQPEPETEYQQRMKREMELINKGLGRETPKEPSELEKKISPEVTPEVKEPYKPTQLTLWDYGELDKGVGSLRAEAGYGFGDLKGDKERLAGEVPLINKPKFSAQLAFDLFRETKDGELKSTDEDYTSNLLATRLGLKTKIGEDLRLGIGGNLTERKEERSSSTFKSSTDSSGITTEESQDNEQDAVEKFKSVNLNLGYRGFDAGVWRSWKDKPVTDDTNGEAHVFATVPPIDIHVPFRVGVETQEKTDILEGRLGYTFRPWNSELRLGLFGRTVDSTVDIDIDNNGTKSSSREKFSADSIGPELSLRTGKLFAFANYLRSDGDVDTKDEGNLILGYKIKDNILIAGDYGKVGKDNIGNLLFAYKPGQPLDEESERALVEWLKTDIDYRLMDRGLLPEQKENELRDNFIRAATVSRAYILRGGPLDGKNESGWQAQAGIPLPWNSALTFQAEQREIEMDSRDSYKEDRYRLDFGHEFSWCVLGIYGEQVKNDQKGDQRFLGLTLSIPLGKPSKK